MSEEGKCAYVTGGASGIGRAVVEMLVKKGAKVFIADMNISAADSLATDLNKAANGNKVQQAKCFDRAIAEFGGRIHYVYPIAGIGERRWLPNNMNSTGWEKPDLSVLDADLNGVLYTISLAMQHFRRQEVDKAGFRGKIGCVASVCGFYCCPTLPIYTAAKHAIVGFVRSYGKYLSQEKITLNAVCPNVIRTNISSGAFYDQVEQAGLLTPMQPIIEAFEEMLGSSDVSGECFEVGPKGGFGKRPAQEYIDKESEDVFERLYHRALPLQKPNY